MAYNSAVGTFDIGLVHMTSTYMYTHSTMDGVTILPTLINFRVIGRYKGEQCSKDSAHEMNIKTIKHPFS